MLLPTYFTYILKSLIARCEFRAEDHEYVTLRSHVVREHLHELLDTLKLTVVLDPYGDRADLSSRKKRGGAEGAAEPLAARTKKEGERNGGRHGQQVVVPDRGSKQIIGQRSIDGAVWENAQRNKSDARRVPGNGEEIAPHTHGLVWLPELQMCVSGLNVFENCFTKATPKPIVVKKYSRLPDLLRNMMENAKRKKQELLW